ncbi:hypothetical protein [Enterovirga sp. CN4-39]|uniref:hypothetical protein n=1 Tax=Enterovirga sp. CN4-39 TaxID=3400910 RepID=UPI003BFAB9D1
MGTLAAWAAAATDWLSVWGPVAWVAAGVSAALASSLVALTVALSVENFTRASLNRKRSREPSGINPLQDNFFKEIITVSDLFSYFHQMHTGKTFRECRFVGPMVIAFGDHVSLFQPRMNQCNFICVQEGWITGVVAFEQSSFKNCEFDSVTFILAPDLANMLHEEAKGKIRILGHPFRPNELGIQPNVAGAGRS